MSDQLESLVYDDDLYTDNVVLLWRTVIIECIIDALWVWTTKGRESHISARYWFGSRDFFEVCHLAMLDPVGVYGEYERRKALCDAGKHDAALKSLMRHERSAKDPTRSFLYKRLKREAIAS